MASDIEKILGITTPNKEQLAAIEAQVQRALALMRQIKEIDDLSKQVRAEFQFLTTRTLPDAMGTAGILEFKTNDGVKVSIKEIVSGSLPKEETQRKAAFEWLIANGGADLIKEHVQLEFGRGQHNEAAMVKGELEKLGQTFAANETVHSSTLAAFARERMRAGEPLPLELLGLYAGRAAKIVVREDEA